MVEVEVASDVDIERTNRFMGSSSLLWAEPLAAAGMLVAAARASWPSATTTSPPDDPVYAMGPLAGAKILQRKTMGEIQDRFGARTARICYPPVATTALGAIPGGLLMYALSAQILKERGQYRDVIELGAASMAGLPRRLRRRRLPPGRGLQGGPARVPRPQGDDHGRRPAGRVQQLYAQG